MSRDTSGLLRGGPGRTPGQPNKATRELRQFIQAVMSDAMSDPQFRQNLVRSIVKLKLNPKILQVLLTYGYGRAPFTLDVALRGQTLEEIVAGVNTTVDERSQPEADVEDDDEPNSTRH